MKTVYKCSYCGKEFNVTNECLTHELVCDKKVDTSFSGVLFGEWRFLNEKNR